MFTESLKKSKTYLAHKEQEENPPKGKKEEEKQARPATTKKRMFANGPNGKVPGTKPQAPENCPRPAGSKLSTSHPIQLSCRLDANQRRHRTRKVQIKRSRGTWPAEDSPQKTMPGTNGKTSGTLLFRPADPATKFGI